MEIPECYNSLREYVENVSKDALRSMTASELVALVDKKDRLLMASYCKNILKEIVPYNIKSCAVKKPVPLMFDRYRERLLVEKSILDLRQKVWTSFDRSILPKDRVTLRYYVNSHREELKESSAEILLLSNCRLERIDVDSIRRLTDLLNNLRVVVLRKNYLLTEESVGFINHLIERGITVDVAMDHGIFSCTCPAFAFNWLKEIYDKGFKDRVIWIDESRLSLYENYSVMFDRENPSSTLPMLKVWVAYHEIYYDTMRCMGVDNLDDCTIRY